MLRAGRHALVSDSDVAWVGSPLPLLDELLRLGATMAASTDCLDAQSDADKTPRKRSAYMCGYNPGNEVQADVVFNTGVVWFKADPTAIQFASEWALKTLALTDPFSDDQARRRRAQRGAAGRGGAWQGWAAAAVGSSSSREQASEYRG